MAKLDNIGTEGLSVLKHVYDFLQHDRSIIMRGKQAEDFYNLWRNQNKGENTIAKNAEVDRIKATLPPMFIAQVPLINNVQWFLKSDGKLRLEQAYAPVGTWPPKNSNLQGPRRVLSGLGIFHKTVCDNPMPYHWNTTNDYVVIAPTSATEIDNHAYNAVHGYDLPNHLQFRKSRIYRYFGVKHGTIFSLYNRGLVYFLPMFVSSTASTLLNRYSIRDWLFSSSNYDRHKSKGHVSIAYLPILPPGLAEMLQFDTDTFSMMFDSDKENKELAKMILKSQKLLKDYIPEPITKDYIKGFIPNLDNWLELYRENLLTDLIIAPLQHFMQNLQQGFCYKSWAIAAGYDWSKFKNDMLNAITQHPLFGKATDMIQEARWIESLMLHIDNL